MRLLILLLCTLRPCRLRVGVSLIHASHTNMPATRICTSHTRACWVTAGYPVTSGCRLILVLFLYVEDFAYGGLLDAYRAEHGCARRGVEPQNALTSDSATQSAPGAGPNSGDGGQRPSGDDPGGYVVYRQTVQLMEMLNKQSVTSVLA